LFRTSPESVVVVHSSSGMFKRVRGCSTSGAQPLFF
jgi:hypothetical protein